MTAARCPACGAGGARQPVWELRGVPVRACTRPGAALDEALAQPRGDLRLAGCRACGHVHNEAFDPALLAAAAPGPADTLAHAAGYGATLRGLAAELVDRWDLRGGRVVEVGCGAGQLLAALRDAGAGHGVGIDPRAPALPPAPGIELIRKPYADRHTGVPADLVASRFLLEHLPEPRPFVELLAAHARGGAGPRAPLVFFEVPDGGATLERAVPWEVYYEHCSYFTAASLAGLARAAGLEPLEVSPHPAHRTLRLVARAARAGRPGPALPAGLEPAGLEGFAARADRRIARWRAELEARAASGVVVWGAGPRATTFLAAVGPRAAAAVACVVDVDPAKRGARLSGSGHEVIAPADLPGRARDTVVVLNELFVDEVGRELARLGLTARAVAA